MRWQQYKRFVLIAVFVLANALRSNVNAASIISTAEQNNEILKTELLKDAKGLVQSAPEICNGNVFQQHIHKLKNSFGSNNSFSVRQTNVKLYGIKCPWPTEKTKIPLFLFNRSILI